MTDTEAAARRYRMSRRGVLGCGAMVSLGSIGLGACAKGAGGSSSSFSEVDAKPPSKYKGRQNVILWTAYADTNGKTLNALLKKFNDSQKDIYAEAQYQGDYFKLEAKLKSAIQAKKTPDLITFGDTSWESFFLDDILEDMDRRFDKGFVDRFVPGLAKVGIVDNKTYWIPFARSTPIFYYNKDVMKKAGLPDRGPKTWSELRDWGSEIRKIKAHGKPMKTIALMGDDDWQFQAQVWHFGGTYSDGLDVKIDSDGSVDCAEWMRKLIFKDKVSYLASDPLKDFMSGVTATAMWSTGSLTEVRNTAKFNFACSPLPKQVGEGVPPGGSGISMLKGISEDRKDASTEVLKFLSSAESSASWALNTGYLPVVKKAANQSDYLAARKKDSNLNVAVEQMGDIRQDDMVRTWVNNTPQNIYHGLQKIYGNNDSSKKVLSEVASKIRKGAKKIEDDYKKYFPKGGS